MECRLQILIATWYSIFGTMNLKMKKFNPDIYTKRGVESALRNNITFVGAAKDLGLIYDESDMFNGLQNMHELVKAKGLSASILGISSPQGSQLQCPNCGTIIEK